MIHAYVVKKSAGRLEPFEYDPGALGPDQVEIEVIACGVCHSDVSMMNNEWDDSVYPLVPGHEVVGTVAQVGANVRHLKIGDTVGLGWFSGSCKVCGHCLSGNPHMCPDAEQTIVGRHGGFANKVRCQAEWATPLPAGLDPKKAGPFFCAGITVFAPLVDFDIRPAQRVGVIGIGGLGHLALQFLNKWGCEVTAFTSSDDKREDARRLGAHHVIHSRKSSQPKKIAGSLDCILSTAPADLDWELYLTALAPKGRLHVLGIPPSAIPVSPLSLIGDQLSISGSAAGSPAMLRTMLDFCLRHRIEPVVEHFPLRQANEALAHLEAGKARYRVVLVNDPV